MSRLFGGPYLDSNPHPDRVSNLRKYIKKFASQKWRDYSSQFWREPTIHVVQRQLQKGIVWLPICIRISSSFLILLFKINGSVAVHAVLCEPVSGVKFPVFREFTGKMGQN